MLLALLDAALEAEPDDPECGDADGEEPDSPVAHGYLRKVLMIFMVLLRSAHSPRPGAGCGARSGGQRLETLRFCGISPAQRYATNRPECWWFAS